MDKNGQNGKPPDASIRFACSFCGRKIRAPKTTAAKKGKCPNCKNILIIPTKATAQSLEGEHIQAATTTEPGSNGSDSLLFNLPPPKVREPEPAAAESPVAQPQDDWQILRHSMGIEDRTPEPPPERKLPWLIDIFLYPTNTAGLISLGVIIGIPIVIDLIMWLLWICTAKLPPLVVFYLAVGFIGWFISLVIWLYAYWYFCECIRDSATGNIRAPETMANTPGLWELIVQTFRIIASIAVFMLPALVYLFYTRRTDTPLWILLACGVFFFPMALLSAIMFDSISGLNPIVVIGSVLSTFLPYLGVVLLYYSITCAITAIVILQLRGILLAFPAARYLIAFIVLYLLFVGGHVLGRFYFRYREKLNWEV